jgi:hypothetical protein
MSLTSSKIEIIVPAGLQAQLVYRMVRTELFPVQLPEDCEFIFLGNLADAVKKFALLKNAYGLTGAAKACAKLLTPPRFAYLIHKNGDVISTGWCMLGQAKFYDTEKMALTIGPIDTSESMRGMGLATIAIQAAINASIVRGTSIFYIDTNKNNFAAQRVFAKCGWGQPVGAYLRNLAG